MSWLRKKSAEIRWEAGKRPLFYRDMLIGYCTIVNSAKALFESPDGVCYGYWDRVRNVFYGYDNVVREPTRKNLYELVFGKEDGTAPQRA